jgi:hypothetical protein
MNNASANFWKRAELFPPLACRLFARTGGPHSGHMVRPMSDAEIVERSGLAPTTVDLLSSMTTWDSVNVATMRAFTKACRMDFTNAVQMRRASQYMRRGLIRELRYLKRSPDWETRWKPMATRWRMAIAKKQKKAEEE